MRFYVKILGFSESDGGVIQIYPTGNEFDIGVIDLYTMEPSFNDIKFQTTYNKAIFGYFPASNNTSYSLLTNLRFDTTTNVKLFGELLDVGDELWLEREKISISSVVDGALKIYNITRGLNGSIPVNHLYSPDSEVEFNIPTLYATTQRLSPIGLLCQFYSTDNTGGDIKILSYGFIKSVTLSNNKLINVTCSHLYKILEKNIIYLSSLYRQAVPLQFILDKTIGGYTNEFFELFDSTSLQDYDVYIPTKKFSEIAPQTNIIEFKDIMKTMFLLKNVYLVFNNETMLYELKILSSTKVTDVAPISVFVSNYFNINDFDVNISVFERLSTMKISYKVVNRDPSEWMDNEQSDVVLTLFDEITQTVSDKSVDIDLTKLLIPSYAVDSITSKLKERLYFLNQVYDVLEFSTTKWFRYFKSGTKYIFNDNHLIKTLFDNTNTPIEWLCLGYNGNKVTFVSADNYARYLISMFNDITYSSSNWNIETNRYIDNNTETLEDGDIVVLYNYDTGSDSMVESNKTINNCSYNTTGFTFNFTVPFTPVSGHIYYIGYNKGTPSGKYENFIYENYGII